MVLSRVFRSEKRDALLIPTFLRGTRGVLAQVLFDCAYIETLALRQLRLLRQSLILKMGRLWCCKGLRIEACY